MSRNIVRAAVDEIQIDSSDAFLDDLRVRLLAALGADEKVSAGTLRQAGELVEDSIEPRIPVALQSVRTGPDRRWRRVTIAIAAAITALVTAGIIVTRAVDDAADPDSTATLNDVDAKQALPLALNAFIEADELGRTFSEQVILPDAVTAQLVAETSAAIPECAALPSFGLEQPSTKSVSPEQFLDSPIGGLGHRVFVFATPEDASRAMDVVGSTFYPKCRSDLFDRMIPLERRVGLSSKSEAWDPPAIAEHGDRQIVFGQRSTFSSSDGSSDVFYVHVFVQVGRAISFVNPHTLPDNKDPLFLVNKAVDVTTDRLEAVFGN